MNIQGMQEISCKMAKRFGASFSRMSFIAGMLLVSSAWANPDREFRTPAKRYGGAYSVLVSLYRNGVEFVVPMWVRPDQKESTIDPTQLVFMGWTFKEPRTEDLVIAGQHFGKKTFKVARSAWALKPEYPKNCCMGVLGRDFLSGYRLRFDPASPVHIEWFEVEQAPPATAGTMKNAQEIRRFEASIPSLFSVRSEVVRLDSRQFDLASTPFVLDFVNRKLTFEREPMVLLKGRPHPIVKFDIAGWSRALSVTEISAPDSARAKDLGLKKGTQITELNGTPVSGLNSYEIESILKGRKSKSVEIGFLKNSTSPAIELKKAEKSKVIFDFEKNEFVRP